MQKFDDYSASFSRVRKDLQDSRGVPYLNFLRGLKPDFGQVRKDVGFGYAMLLVTLIATAIAPALVASRLVVGLLAGIMIGYWIAYLQLFLHEAAHFNLAADREASDRFADRYISWFIGTTVASYRKIHFQHHRALGTVDDSEQSYFFPLNFLFFVKGLSGVRALEVMMSRRKTTQQLDALKQERQRDSSSRQPQSNWGFWAAPIAHGAIVFGTLLAGFWWVSLAWLLGVGAFFPFFGALRQILEHRDEGAANDVDYTRVNHGAVTRMFKDGPVGSTFGGAGFNRHLLHHWEPQVSYTNLPALERYLLDTPLASVIAERKTTYHSAFIRLFSL